MALSKRVFSEFLASRSEFLNYGRSYENIAFPDNSKIEELSMRGEKQWKSMVNNTPVRDSDYIIKIP